MANNRACFHILYSMLDTMKSILAFFSSAGVCHTALHLAFGLSFLLGMGLAVRVQQVVGASFLYASGA